MSDRISTRQFVTKAASRWWLIVVLAVLGAGAGYGASALMDPIYQARTSLLVGQVLRDPDLTSEEIDTSQKLAVTYADMVQRRPVLEAVARELGLGLPWQTLRQRVRATASPDESQLILVTAEADSPHEASLLVSAIADSVIAMSPTESEFREARTIQTFVRSRLKALQHDILRFESEISSLRAELAETADPAAVAELQTRIEDNRQRIIEWQSNYSALLSSRLGEGVPNFLRVFERAESFSDPVWPRIPVNTAIGGGAGLLIALVVVYVLEIRRGQRRRQEEELWARPSVRKRSPLELVETVRRSSRELVELATQLTDEETLTEAALSHAREASRSPSTSPPRLTREVSADSEPSPSARRGHG